MPDSISTRVTPGQPLTQVVTADRMNALMEAARLILAAGAMPTGGLPLTAQLNPSTTVLVCNQTGESVPAYGVYRLDGATIDVNLAPHNFNRRPMFDGAAVEDAENDVVAIGSGPAAAGAFVRAVVAGVTVAKVLVEDPADQYARPLEGVTTHLISTDSPTPIRLLWSPLSGSGVEGETSEPVYAVVLLGGGCCDGASGSGATIDVVTEVCVVIEEVGESGSGS